MLDELLAEFGIGHLRRTPALALSGGERRRVEIARALATQPGLHPAGRAAGRHRSDRRRRNPRSRVGHLKHRGIGVLITDHNVRETLEIIDRAYIMHDGKVLMEGQPRRGGGACRTCAGSIWANGSALDRVHVARSCICAESVDHPDRPISWPWRSVRASSCGTAQTLVMTPQLRQAIKLLQFSNIEVAAFVEEELERNPLLERDEPTSAPLPSRRRRTSAGDGDADRRRRARALAGAVPTAAAPLDTD